jgi:hypothetical protein
MRLRLFAFCLVLLIPANARADPWFDWGENALEDAFVDGDIDEEDHVALRVGAHSGVADLRGGSWISLAGFRRQLLSGRNDTGGIVVVGLALDRIAAGPVHQIADPVPPSPGPPQAARTPSLQPLVPPSLARDCVAAALRASGLGVDDARIDSIASRSRTSALLPETRLRAMRLWNDAVHTTTLATTDGTNYYDAVGANLVLELRMTWRLDRLVFAGDEPTLERVRLERQDARSRLATRTLEVLFAWQRAALQLRSVPADSPEHIEALLRESEAEATLDVLTGGWFTDRDARAPDPP